MRFTPWVVSEHVPDYSSLERLFQDPRFAGKRGEALAVAIWELLVDRDLGIFHYDPPLDPLWKKSIQDPLEVLNVFGFTICRCHAHVQAILGLAAGLPARIANVDGHEGTEFFYDGKWHYFDCDIQMYYRLRPPHEHCIASREELFRDPSLVTDQPNPSRPYHLPDRDLAICREMYVAEPEYLPVLEERIHSMNYRLRPGEELVRYFHPCGRWVVYESYPPSFRRNRDRMTGPEGPTERFWPRRQWGNGYFHYAPKLTSQAQDLALGADSVEGLALTLEGLVCEDSSGYAIFAFESPYLYCGVPDPLGRVPSECGALLSAKFNLPPGTTARVEAAPEHSSVWQTVWASEAGASGAIAAKADFTAIAEGAFRLRMRICLDGPGASLCAFETRLWFMVSPHSLPALRRTGANRMRLHSGDRYGLETRTVALRLLTDQTDAVSRAVRTDNLRHDPLSYARFLPADPALPWQAVYALAAPGGGRMAWISAFALFEGRRPEEASDSTPARIEMAAALEAPWQIVAEQEIVPHVQGWHFGVFGEQRFTDFPACAFVRFSAKKGLKGFKLAAQYLSREPLPKSVPLEIEHVWYEDDPRVGRRERTHMERTSALDHEYAVACANEPHNELIRMRVPSLPV